MRGRSGWSGQCALYEAHAYSGNCTRTLLAEFNRLNIYIFKGICRVGELPCSYLDNEHSMKEAILLVGVLRWHDECSLWRHVAIGSSSWMLGQQSRIQGFMVISSDILTFARMPSLILAGQVSVDDAIGVQVSQGQCYILARNCTMFGWLIIFRN